MAEGYVWFSLSAASGNNDGSKRRDAIAPQHSPQALKKAQALARISRIGLLTQPAAPRQLRMEFPAPSLPARPQVDLRAGLDDNPDVYAVLLRALLDHGELAPGQVRAIFDRCGGERCGIGGYLACVVAIALLGRRALARSPLLVPATAAVILVTAAMHAVFFGSGRYGLVVVPFVTALAFARPVRGGGTAAVRASGPS